MRKVELPVLLPRSSNKHVSKINKSFCHIHSIFFVIYRPNNLSWVTIVIVVHVKSLHIDKILRTAMFKGFFLTNCTV